MNYSVQLNSENWRVIKNDSGDQFNLIGLVFQNNQPLSGENFAAQTSEKRDDHLLCNLLKKLGGFYSWVEQSSNMIRAGVDHIRSKPLFYTSINDTFFLSDNAEWVRSKAGDEKMDPVAKEEFQLTGYVTGSDTLYPNVKQLQAGEFLIASEKSTGLSIEKYRYNRFIHTKPQNIKSNLLKEHLNIIAEKSIQNLIEYADNRQVVVPLSGGYDSRIILLLLKKLGYKNILTFTYGVPGNREADISKKVADILDIPWKFVQYTKSGLAKNWSGSDAKAYREFSSNHSSLPHIQDWFAVKNLLEDKIIEPNSVIVPGHTGDFISGGHIPPIVFSGDNFLHKDVINAIINIHYSNKPKEKWEYVDFESLSDRISSRIDLPFDGSAVSFANSVEVWNWQERQAKYIVNSVRVYDYFNLDWWLPMWDLNFMNFWKTVPLSLRKRRNLFIDWVDERCEEEGLVINSSTGGNSNSKRTNIKSVLRPFYDSFPTTIQFKLRSSKRWIECKLLKKGFENHFLAFEGLIPKNELDKYYISGYDIIGTYSDLFLKGKWDCIEGWE